MCIYIYIYIYRISVGVIIIIIIIVIIISMVILIIIISMRRNWMRERWRISSGAVRRQTRTPRLDHQCRQIDMPILRLRSSEGNSQGRAKSSPDAGPSAGAEVESYGSCTFGAFWI